VGERKILLLARIDAPAVEGSAILLRESLHFCFGSADVVVVKRERAHADLAQLQQLRTEMLAAGYKEHTAQTGHMLIVVPKNANSIG
jgi:hypothetical protein